MHRGYPHKVSLHTCPPHMKKTVVQFLAWPALPKGKANILYGPFPNKSHRQ
jgi:hypothetical protein